MAPKRVPFLVKQLKLLLPQRALIGSKVTVMWLPIYADQTPCG
jgi:hypothetical protein